MPRQGESPVVFGTGCIMRRCQSSEAEQSKRYHLCLTENWGTAKHSNLFGGHMEIWAWQVYERGTSLYTMTCPRSKGDRTIGKSIHNFSKPVVEMRRKLKSPQSQPRKRKAPLSLGHSCALSWRLAATETHDLPCANTAAAPLLFTSPKCRLHLYLSKLAQSILWYI